MDYSATMQDDHPAGASPWGNSPTSSPGQQRTGFGSILGEGTPVPAFHNGLAQDQEGGFGSQDTSFRRPNTASTTSGTEPGNDESATAAFSGSQHHGTSTPFGHDAETGQETPPKAPDNGSAPASESQGQQSQRPSQPQKPLYRLVAKITGLERTGKKDPILRFDVHVSLAEED